MSREMTQFKYRLIIFDFDGTLADSFPWALSIYDEMIDRYQLKHIDKEDVSALRGFDARQIIKLFGVRWWKLPALAKDVATMMTRDADQIPLFAGINELLKSLSEMGVMLAIVTSNSLENVGKILGPENMSLVSYFECGAGLFGKHTKFKKILRKSGVSASEALSIGDEIRDIQAAKKSNIASGAVSWGYTHLDALVGQAPDEIFTNVGDILKRFQ
jgi:phosphoglycolate phosphatase